MTNHFSKWDKLEISDSDDDEQEDGVNQKFQKLVRQFASIQSDNYPTGQGQKQKPVMKPEMIGDKGLDSLSKDQEVKQRQHIQKSEHFEATYLSQHAKSGSGMNITCNIIFDAMNAKGRAASAPSYKSGINPNFFDEYFAELVDPSDLTNTAECRSAIWDEYQGRRWSYFTHLSGYHSGTIQEGARKIESVEFWRRFHLLGQPPPSILNWYFNERRKIGDVIPHMEGPLYLEGVSDVCYPDFSNCPVPPRQILTLGTIHIAVGFVDLGLLLDARIIEPPEVKNPLLFRGFEASSFAVAKSLVMWEMLCTPETKASWVVQVWFSTVWSKRATNAFLAAAHRVAVTDDFNNTKDNGGSRGGGHPPNVCLLVRHWSLSKGVGLKKLVRRRSSLRNESSNALFFARKQDRVEMIRYHLTGAFGLLGEEPCSGSVCMFDCPPASVKHDAASVFHTLTMQDVASSELYNGSYFQTAEKVKEARVTALLVLAQSGKIQVQLNVAILAPTSPALEEIIRLQPHSLSWSNVLDYMSHSQFHSLAKACSKTAVHTGYSMNWPSIIYGASLIDYPESSLQVIREAEKSTAASMRKLCRGRQVFLTPIQHNPLNTTAGLLAYKCHSFWIGDFFSSSGAHILEAGMLDCPGNPLGRVNVVVFTSWTYRDNA